MQANNYKPMYFKSNIKLLRKRLGRTQDDIAFSLQMKRSTLSGYENGIAQPNMETLVAFSKFFRISIDTLIKVNLPELLESELSQLERGYDVFITGSKLRVLATTVDSENIENIELGELVAFYELYGCACEVVDCLGYLQDGVGESVADVVYLPRLSLL